jgi:diaminohydroxyphosphoribosylaminopyrimidine deaminase/5-amino-6-(5-phosphoribosylamino)uracil reductase
MVGAVIVRGGSVVGKGFHRCFGGAHAEVEAIADARRAGHDLAGATLYVTLEPCCHYGKTPPCTQAVMAAGLGRVVVAMADPDARVSGKGLDELRAAGISATVGVLEQEARHLLAAYVKLRTRGRPWVICKWAQSLDGKIATAARQSKWITGEPARNRAHHLRSLCDGVCVGVGTVLADDPLLTNRSGGGRQPTRLVLDAGLRTPLDSQLVRSARDFPLIVATGLGALAENVAAMAQAGVEILTLNQDGPRLDLGQLLDELGSRQWTYLLVEGGQAVLRSFLRQELADELAIFVAPCIIGGDGLSVTDWVQTQQMSDALRLPPAEVEQLGHDMLLRFRLNT